MQLNNQKLTLRLEMRDRRLETLMLEQQLQLTKLNNRVDTNHQQIRSGLAVPSKVSEHFERIKGFGQDIKGIMQDIFNTTRAIFKLAVDIRDRLPSHLERSFYGRTFILEDSIGRSFPITMQFISSWDAFDAALEVQFRDRQGQRMVQQKRYVLHESSANRDIDRRFPLEAEFRPGQRIVMCMVFIDYLELKCCPNCYDDSQFLEESDIKW